MPNNNFEKTKNNKKKLYPRHLTIIGYMKHVLEAKELPM